VVDAHGQAAEVDEEVLVGETIGGRPVYMKRGEIEELNRRVDLVWECTWKRRAIPSRADGMPFTNPRARRKRVRHRMGGGAGFTAGR